ncbi:MAG: Gfo/Idh/MocA family oxidoreductase [Deltaproteobacteria bacterium]|nr:Gfo/Idh/MocA family oxidoreductase [Deltaproteobacteria bacterium]
MAEQKSLQVAQLGAGYWGPNLIRNFYQIKAINQFFVCDLEQANLDKIKANYPKISTTTDIDAILKNPDIDAVIVAIPAFLHYEYAKRALLAGKHVFVEKPLSTTVAESQELIDLAEKNKKVLMVGHTFLYNGAVKKIKEYIDNGELGEVYYILSQRLNLGRVRQDVNALWNLAPHDISIILYWLGEKPSNISTKGLIFLQKEIEDVVFVDLDFPSGRSAHIHVSWLDPSKTRKMVVVGSKKMIVYDDVSNDAKIVIYDKGIDRKNIIRNLPAIESYGHFQLMNREGDILIPKIDFKEPLKVECQHFVDCIINQTAPLTDGRNGLDVVEVLEKAQLMLNSQRKK